ncbi:unnamed protein product [Durusdinium trenchii]|uniref:Uncharacterized protein n=1 Tax=Durusdinium trenchii TaxID=1381693 RepID=A0ABP0PXJ0_9DINO
MPKAKCAKTTVASTPGSRSSANSTPPSTPGTSAPATPAESVALVGEGEVDESNKKRKRPKKAEEQTPLTPLQKANDMCNKLLKKKSDSSNLGLTLQAIPYASALSGEMTRFSSQFERLETDYIPLVKDFISLQKQFEKPQAAATALSRQSLQQRRSAFRAFHAEAPNALAGFATPQLQHGFCTSHVWQTR